MKIFQIVLVIITIAVAGCGSNSPSPAKNTPQASDGYPLDVCVVSGRKLGSMGDPYVIKYQGTPVKLCCSSCLKEFNSDPAKYMAILNEAEKKAAPK